MKSSYRIAFLLAAVILFLLQVWHFSPYTMDDAFISFRYAQHLAQGYGFVWNIGEHPVEGFTNFLWVLMLALCSLLQFDLVIAVKVISIIPGLITIILLERTSQTISGSESAINFFPSLVYAAVPVASFHAAEGLETTFYTLLILFTLHSVFSAIQSGKPSCYWKFYLGVLLSAMTRPEGVLFGAAIFLLLIFSSDKKKMLHQQSIRSFVIIFLVGALYFIWRWIYFGYLFPNPFYIKHGLVFYHPNGIMYVLSFILLYVFIPFLTNLYYRKREISPSFSRVLLAPIALILLFYIGVDPLMGTAHRYLVPLYPACLLLALPAVKKNDGKRFHLILLPFIIAALIPLILTYVDLNREAYQYSKGMRSAHIKIGKALYETYAHPEARLLVCGDAGAIPYYSTFRTIDLIGLNNPSLVHHGFSAETIFAQQPDVLVLYSKNGFEVSGQLGNGNDGRLARSGRMKEFENVGALLFNTNYYLIVFARKGTREAVRLKNRLNAGDE